MPHLDLSFLGTLQVALDGQLVTGFESDKVRALLAFLAMEADLPHRRDALTALIWPEWPDRSARANLRNALANLRGAINDRNADPPFLLITRETIQFNLKSQHRLDAAEFTRLAMADDPDSWQEAIALYRGSFLEGFQIKESAPFEDWHLLTRERLQRQASSSLRRLTAHFQQCGEYGTAIDYAWRQIELEPWYEQGHQQLMRLLALSGQRSVALAQFDACARRLEAELGVEPSPETVRLMEQIRNGELAPPALESDVTPVAGEPPYKGLQYFDQDDAEIFYGREPLTQRMLARLDVGTGSRFLAVVGASGSGKSSIVRAGLVPAVQRGKASTLDTAQVSDSSTWPIVVLTPSVHPLEKLAAELTPAEAPLSATTDLIHCLARDPRSLHRQICRLVPKNADRFLLIIDQFEELFTQCEEPAERHAFVDNLMTAGAEEGPTIVVITLRSDFYAHCGAYTALREALEANQIYIGPMRDAELRRAVTEPAKRNGWLFEPGLVDLLLQEVSEEPGALPLLSHALLETWKRRRGRMMTLAGYSESGGVRGAIAQTAERVLQEQSPDQQAITRTIFLRLTELRESTQETRRRARLSEVAPRPEDADAVEKVLAMLVSARLITISENSVEVAHEALIREWPTLRGWLEEDRASLMRQRHLTNAALAWDRLARDSGELYRGSRLAAAEEWAATHSAEMNPLERAFLQASRALADRQMQEREAHRQRELAIAQQMLEVERKRAQEQARSAKRLRRGALALAGAALIAVGLAVIAFNARTVARREAAVNRSLVLASLAEEANEAGEGNRALALGLEAINLNAPPPAAIRKLAKVAGGMGTRAILIGHNGPVLAGAFRPDGRQAVSGGCEQPDDLAGCSAGELILWDLGTMAEVTRWRGHDGWVTALAWSPNGDFALSGGEDGTLIQWESAGRREMARWDLGDGAIQAIAFSPDGVMAASADANGSVVLLNVAEDQIGHRLHGHEGRVLAIAFSPNGEQLLSGAEDATMILWDVGSGQPVRTFTGHSSAVTGLAFSLDGETILSSGDLSLRLWETATGQELKKRESGDIPDGLALSPDGRTVIHYVSHILYTWDVNEWNTPHRKLFGHIGDMNVIQISGDGRLALSGGDDGTVQIWNLRGADDIRQASIGFPATSVAVDPNGNQLALAGWGTCSMIWDLTSAQSTVQFSGCRGIVAPGGIAFSPDGRWVAATSGDYDHGTEDANLLIWDVTTGDIHCDLQGHARRERTVAFSPDSRMVLSGSQGTDDAGDLILWGVDECNLIRRFATEQDTTGIDFSQDGRYAVTSSAFAANATLWNVETGQPIRAFPMDGEVFLDAVFGPGDRSVLAAAISGMIVEWDRETGQEVRRLIGHDGGVWSVALSSDEKQLVSSDDTGTVILWDAVSGEELRRHNAHNALSFQAAFSPDNETVYSASADETLVAWQIGDLSLHALLSWIDENRYVRALTCAERELYDIHPLCE